MVLALVAPDAFVRADRVSWFGADARRHSSESQSGNAIQESRCVAPRQPARATGTSCQRSPTSPNRSTLGLCRTRTRSIPTLRATRSGGSTQEGTRMIIDVPEGQDPIIHVWGEMVPGIGPAAAKFAQASTTHSTLGLREFEAARLRIAQINGCLFCQDWRTERDGVKVEDSFADAVDAAGGRPTSSTTAPGWPRSTPSATRRPPRLDDDFWSRMKAHYSDARSSSCRCAWALARLRPPQPGARPRHRLRAARHSRPRRPDRPDGRPPPDRMAPCRPGPAQPPPPGGRHPPPHRTAARRAPRPGPGPPPPAPHRPGLAARDARRRPQAGRDAAAAARARRHVRRRVPDHPLQPEGDRRLGGAGRRGGDGDPGGDHRGADRLGRPLARRSGAPDDSQVVGFVGSLGSLGLGHGARQLRHDPGDRDDRPRHRRGRGRAPAHPRRGLGGHPRQALAAGRARVPARVVALLSSASTSLVVGPGRRRRRRHHGARS